jgi:hypothetical protein
MYHLALEAAHKSLYIKRKLTLLGMVKTQLKFKKMEHLLLALRVFVSMFTPFQFKERLWDLQPIMEIK